MPEHDKHYADSRFSYYGPNGRGASSSAFQLMAYPQEISQYRQYADFVADSSIPEEMESAAAEVITSNPYEQHEAVEQEEGPINMQERG